jgi:hypothetical protein
MIEFWEIVVVEKGRHKGKTGVVLGKPEDGSELFVAVWLFHLNEVWNIQTIRLRRTGYLLDGKTFYRGDVIEVSVDVHGRGTIVGVRFEPPSSNTD